MIIFKCFAKEINIISDKFDNKSNKSRIRDLEVRQDSNGNPLKSGTKQLI